MSLTDIEAVRLKSSDKSSITREQGVGDGDSTHFKLGHQSILSSPDIEVRINDTVTTAYTMDHANGIVTFTTAPLGQTALVDADQLEFVYYWSVFSDNEVQYFIDEAGGNVTIATARLLLAIAADASKVAQRQSLAGGGGLGAVTIDTSVTARELRATAAALVEMEGQISDTVPAEGLTEPAWTEFQYKQGVDQNIIRNN
jgi:hypothetical protein